MFLKRKISLRKRFENGSIQKLLKNRSIFTNSRVFLAKKAMEKIFNSYFTIQIQDIMKSYWRRAVGILKSEEGTVGVHIVTAFHLKLFETEASVLEKSMEICRMKEVS